MSQEPPSQEIDSTVHNRLENYNQLNDIVQRQKLDSKTLVLVGRSLLVAIIHFLRVEICKAAKQQCLSSVRLHATSLNTLVYSYEATPSMYISDNQIRLLKDLAFHTAKQLVRHSGWVHVTVPADSDMLPE